MLIVHTVEVVIDPRDLPRDSVLRMIGECAENRKVELRPIEPSEAIASYVTYVRATDYRLWEDVASSLCVMADEHGRAEVVTEYELDAEHGIERVDRKAARQAERVLDLTTGWGW